MTGSCDCIGLDVRADQQRSAANSRLPLLGFDAIESGALESPGDTTGHVTCSFGQTGGKRAIRHDWTKAEAEATQACP